MGTPKPLDVLRWQGRKRGLLEIGYHLVVDRAGAVHRIRHVRCVGSHTPGYNHLSVGVCLLGGRDAEDQPADNFTGYQTAALEAVASAFLREWPAARVVRHGDLKGYQGHLCPAMSLDATLDVATVMAAAEAHPTLSEMTRSRHDGQHSQEGALSGTA